MKSFIDYLKESINTKQSLLCAGLDLDFNKIPKTFHHKDSDLEKRVKKTIVNFYEASFEAISPYVACVKPNSAFFERYGIAGLKALNKVTKMAKDLKLPVILDAKRGDIGSTNLAYAEGYLSEQEVFGEKINTIYADALTVNPSLGLEAVEPFITVANNNGKGIFFLVRTSNPDSAPFQLAKDEEGKTVSDTISHWINSKNNPLLGAVIGATRKDEALHFRDLMPNSLFLIPGYGAQGGSAQDALTAKRAGTKELGDYGIVVNSSRGLFQEACSSAEIKATEFIKMLTNATKDSNSELR